MKNFIKQTSILSIAITVAFVIYMGVQIAQGAGTWNDPTAVPPGDNTEEPINAGNKPQTKSGNLTVNVLRAGGLVSDFSSYLATISGSVGIGTVSPNTGGEQNLKLDVEGAVGAQYYCDETGNKCIKGDSLGGGGCPAGYDSVTIGNAKICLINSAFLSTSIECNLPTSSTCFGEARNNGGILQTRAYKSLGYACDSGWVSGRSASCLEYAGGGGPSVWVTNKGIQLSVVNSAPSVTSMIDW